MYSLARADLCCFVIFAALLSANSVAQSQPTTAHVHITIVKSPIGDDGGSGAMFLKGHRRYRLSMGGIQVTTGVRDIDLSGTVINLENPADIKGAYHTLNGGSSIVGGTRTVKLENDKGVILIMHAEKERREFSVDLAGMTISGRRF